MKIITFALLLALATAELAPLLHTENANIVPGSYIIALKDGLEITDRDAHVLTLKDQILATGATENEVVHLYNIGNWMGFSAKLSKDMLMQQLAHPNVAYIEADQMMSINYIQELRSPLATVTQTGATWGIDRVDQLNLPLSGSYVYNSVAGSGVDVYVIDTGILTTHTDFGGRATSVYNAITGESNQDLNGHGTHCSGTIGGTKYGVAKNVNLKAVKVLGADGSGTTSGVIAGVNYVTNNKSASRRSVASMSLGGGASTSLDQAVTSAVAAGVPFAVAAGNDNANACNSSPARAATAVTVGATDSTDTRSYFSNYGTCVDIFAPGSSITSDWIGSSNSATNTISGTSMATPHVAGAIALLLGTNNGATPTQVTATLTTGANGNAGKVKSPGTGSPNFLLYTNPQ